MLIESRLGRELQAYRLEVHKFYNVPCSLFTTNTADNYTHTVDLINKLSVGIIEDYVEILKPSQLKEIAKTLSTVLAQNLEYLKSLHRKWNSLQAKKMDSGQSKRVCDYCGDNLEENKIRKLKFSLQQNYQQRLQLGLKELRKEGQLEIFGHSETAEFEQALLARLDHREQMLSINGKRVEEFIEIMNGSLVELKKIKTELFSDHNRSLPIGDCEGIHRINEHVSEFLQTSFQKKIPPWIHKMFERLIKMYLQERKATRKDYGIQASNNQDQNRIEELKEKLRQHERLNQAHKRELKELKDHNDQLTVFKTRALAFNNIDNYRTTFNRSYDISELERIKQTPAVTALKNIGNHRPSQNKGVNHSGLQSTSQMNQKFKDENLPSINKKREKMTLDADKINAQAKDKENQGRKQIPGRNTEKNRQAKSIAKQSDQESASLLGRYSVPANCQMYDITELISQATIGQKAGITTKKSIKAIKHHEQTIRTTSGESKNQLEHQIAKRVLKNLQTNAQARLQHVEGYQFQSKVNEEPKIKPLPTQGKQLQSESSPQGKSSTFSQTLKHKPPQSSSQEGPPDKGQQPETESNRGKYEDLHIRHNYNFGKNKVPHPNISEPNSIASKKRQNKQLTPKQAMLQEDCSNSQLQRLTHQIYNAIQNNSLLPTMNFTEFKTLIEEERVKQGASHTSALHRSSSEPAEQMDAILQNQFKETQKQSEKTSKEKLNVNCCNNNQSLFVNELGDQLCSIFGSKALTYKYEKSLRKNYHMRKNKQLNKQQNMFCHRMYEKLECLKSSKRGHYNQFCSLIRYPYQTLYNEFEVINFVTDMKFETFEFYFRKICCLHRKCEKEPQKLSCQHLDRFLQIIESHAGS